MSELRRLYWNQREVRGAMGRGFAAAVVMLPVLLLFHPAFLSRVVVPMFHAFHSVMPTFFSLVTKISL